MKELMNIIVLIAMNKLLMVKEEWLIARGSLAKEDVAKKIAAAFGADYIGEADKKWYVWGEENGEKVQIAISMTCPKAPVEVMAVPKSAEWNFDEEPQMMVTAPAQNIEITAEERDNIAVMMARLGL